MTCHAEGWKTYGRNMVSTFVRHWPTDVTLEVYAEGFDLDITAPNVIERRLPAWHTAWKDQHANNEDAHGRNTARFGKTARVKGKGYDYRRDCVRFSHKVAALTDAALDTGATPAPGSWLILADADLITHASVTIDWLHSLVADKSFYLAWLDRVNWYPECGFVIFREDHPSHRWFMEKFRAIYQTNEVFALPETHDSFVLQQLVAASLLGGRIPRPVGLSGRRGATSSHPFVYSRLAERLDHAKGKFKGGGRTPKGYVIRGEAYWK